MKQILSVIALALAAGCADYRSFQRDVGGYEHDYQLPGKQSVATHIADHTTGPIGYGIKKAGQWAYDSTGESAVWGVDAAYKGPVTALAAVGIGTGHVVQYLPQSIANTMPFVGDSWDKCLFDPKFRHKATRPQMTKAAMELVGFWIPVSNRDGLDLDKILTRDPE